MTYIRSSAKQCPAPLWEAQAEPYGELRGQIGLSADPGLRYPGQWQDELDLEATCVGDTCTMPGPLEDSYSLFENGYRWYKPVWGRYGQADPIQDTDRATSFKLAAVNQQKADLIFGYSSDNPIRYLDSLGLCTDCDECPSGKWRYSAIPSYSFVTLSGLIESKGTYRCVGNEEVGLSVTITCEAFGPLIAGGVGFEGSARAGCGCSRDSLLSTSSGSYFSLGPYSISRTAGVADPDCKGWTIGMGRSIGAGGAMVDCVVSKRERSWWEPHLSGGF